MTADPADLSRQAAEPVLAVTDLCVRREGTLAVEHVSFQLARETDKIGRAHV